ncbi:hypothetical protein ACP275_08G082000 [Erythranthe tilingii]
MSENKLMLFTAIVAAVFYLHADAYDPDPLQDFCVAVNDSKAAVFVNGKICKDPETVTADDFFHSGRLNRPGNITSPFGTKVTMVFINQLPGLNTLGVATARIDFEPGGVNPPHLHPRAFEILVVLKGTLYAGFVTSNPTDKNRLFAKILKPGIAVALVGFNSQNPGVVTVSKAVFGSDPPVEPDTLAKGFQLDVDVVRYLQSLLWIGNN